MIRIPIYLAHQLNAATPAERNANRARATRWTCWIAERYACAPVATWILLADGWPETPERRETGIEIDKVLVELCRTIVLVGPRISEGMGFELARADVIVDLVSGYNLHEPPADGWSRIAEFDDRMAAAGIRRAE